MAVSSRLLVRSVRGPKILAPLRPILDRFCRIPRVKLVGGCILLFVGIRSLLHLGPQLGSKRFFFFLVPPEGGR